MEVFALCLNLKLIAIKRSKGFSFYSHKTHSSWTLLLVYCCLSCMLDPVPASVASSWYLALFNQAYRETISVWLIVAALQYGRISHPAGLRELCAVSCNLWLLHLLRGSDHLNIAQCWMSNRVQPVWDMRSLITFTPLKWIPNIAVQVWWESAVNVHIE